MKKNESVTEDFGPETLGPIFREIKSGGSEKLKEFVKEHLNFALNHGFMHDAAEYDNTEALKVFMDAGAHPDDAAVQNGLWEGTALLNAISYRAYNAVNYLLDAGADLENTENDTYVSPLIRAAGKDDLDMVKLLLDRGADVNSSYLREGKERFNALKRAVIDGHREVADYLRSKGAVMPTEEKNSTPDPEEQLLDALSRHFKGKPLPLGITEIVPASVPLMVHIFPPVEGKRSSTIFATVGLSEYALIVPKNKDKYQFAEYFIEMPGAWPVTDEALDQDEYFWPISWLKAIGRYPHEKQTYYGEKKTVTAKMIPTLSTPDGLYCSAAVERCPEMDFHIPQDGRDVVYYRVTPLKGA